MAINPGDLGALFSLVPGMPKTYAERFSTCSSWRAIYETLEALEAYAGAHSITLSM